MLIDLIMNDRRVDPLPEGDERMKTAKKDCLGGLREKPNMPGAEANFMRQEIMKYTNVIDVTFLVCALGSRFREAKTGNGSGKK
jgi:hypothetical protein